jgi:hypothetical protein
MECGSTSAEKKDESLSHMDGCLMSGFRNRSVGKYER